MAVRPPARRLTLGLALLLAGCTASAPTPPPVAAVPSPAVVASAVVPSSAPTAAPATPLPTATPVPTPEPTPAPTAEPKPTPTARSGGVKSGATGRVQVDGEDLAIRLPKRWVTLSLSESDIEHVVAAIPKGAVPAGLRDQLPALLGAGLRLWAFDTRPADLGDNVSIVTQPVSVPYPLLETAARAAISQYPNVSHVVVRDATVDGEPALRVDYRLTIEAAGRPVKTTGTQLYIPRTGRLVLVTISVRAGHSADDVKQLVNGIQLLD
jgi:hypothetical protein